MRKITCFLAALLFCAACAPREEGSVLTMKVDTQNITLLGKDSGLPADSIGVPRRLLSMGDYVMLGPTEGEMAISIYNTRSGHFQKVGRKGRGHNEIQSVGKIGIYPLEGKQAFFVFDGFTDKVYVYVLEGDSCELFRVEETQDFQEFEFDNNRMVGINDETRRYVLRDTQTGAETHFGETEYLAELNEKINKSMYIFTINSKRNRLACFSFSGEALEIIDYSNPENIKYPFHKIYLSVIYARQEERIISGKSKRGFGNVASNDENIFVLCDDKISEDFFFDPTLDMHLFDNICVFDWKGKYVKRLICDKPIRSLSFNREKNELFALILDDDAYYKVFSFPLNEII